MTPSIQEYHIRNCLTFKKHTNLWVAFELSKTLSYGSRLNSAKRFPMGRV
ncbi:hypothetical protein [Leptospira interrogans]|nr:hypothetical protein [Leptospira interrogans]